MHTYASYRRRRRRQERWAYLYERDVARREYRRARRLARRAARKARIRANWAAMSPRARRNVGVTALCGFLVTVAGLILPYRLGSVAVLDTGLLLMATAAVCIYWWRPRKPEASDG